MINQINSTQKDEKVKRSIQLRESKISNTEISNISSISNFLIDTENPKKSSQNNSLNSVLCLTETNSEGKNMITIKLSKEKKNIEIELALAEKGFPDILSKMNYETKTLIIDEKWLDNKTIKDYYFYVKICYSSENMNNNLDLSNLRFNFKKLTQLANYFENDRILAHMIKMNIEPNISCETCINLINDAFKYCSNDNLNSTLKSKWFNLFLKLRNFITTNFIYFLSLPGKNQIIKLNVKLFEEIIETFLTTIYTKRIEITSEQASQIVLFIVYLRNKNNDEPHDFDTINYDLIFSFLNKEKEYLCSPENLLEISNFSNPTFSLNLLKDVNYNYQEHIVPFFQQELIFISKYDNNTDTFTISLKLNPVNTIDVFTFVSFGQIIEDEENNEINFCSINNSSKITIYTINSYKGYVNYMKGIKELSNLNLVINLKFCIIDSFLICFLKSAFDEIYNINSIKLLPPSIFNVLLSNSNFKEDYMLIAIMKWLSDNTNDTDKIIDVLDKLDWKKVPLGRIFEFVIKFPYTIERNESVENCIIAAIFAKANEKLIEMKREKIYSERMNETYLERKITQFSYEGDLEKCEAIVNENNNINNIFNSNNSNRESNNVNLISEESQINLLSYFFVNLLECSKKLNYQYLASSVEFLKKEIMFARKSFKKETTKEKDKQLDTSNLNTNYFNISKVSNCSNKSIKSNNIINLKISVCESDRNKMPSIILKDENKLSIKNKEKSITKDRQKNKENKENKDNNMGNRNYTNPNTIKINDSTKKTDNKTEENENVRQVQKQTKPSRAKSSRNVKIQDDNIHLNPKNLKPPNKKEYRTTSSKNSTKNINVAYNTSLNKPQKQINKQKGPSIKLRSVVRGSSKNLPEVSLKTGGTHKRCKSEKSLTDI